MRKAKIVTKEFDTRKGVLQGCPISRHLSNLYLVFIMRVAQEEHVKNGVKIAGLHITNLRYAGDIVLLTEPSGKLQVITDSVYTTCSKYTNK